LRPISDVLASTVFDILRKAIDHPIDAAYVKFSTFIDLDATGHYFLPFAPSSEGNILFC
jgi:hypothetical protein